MTRGTDTNLAFVFTTPARAADPQPGTRPAPELDRYDRIRREREGYPPDQPAPASPGGADPREPIAVLADVLGRDGAELSASAIRQRNLANADHLAVLHAIWTAETRSRPPRPVPRPGHGRAAARLPAAAVAPGPVAVPHPARRRTGRPGPRRGHPARPSPPGTWPEPGTSPPSWTPGSGRASTRCSPSRRAPGPSRVPEPARPRPPRLPGPDRGHDGRPHPAPRPARRPDRARLGGHRPRPGARRPGRPPRLGDTRQPRSPPTARCTATTTPTTRSAPNPAARHRTSGPPGTRRSPPSARPTGPTSAAMPDGRLWLIRDTYAAETAWAPRHVGKELRLARLGAADADLGAIRAAAEADAARKAGDHDRADRHEDLAASYQAMRDHYRQQETIFAQTMADRQEWDHATAGSRQLAIAADAELRRRHPGQNQAAALRRTRTLQRHRPRASSPGTRPGDQSDERLGPRPAGPVGSRPHHAPRPAGIERHPVKIPAGRPRRLLLRMEDTRSGRHPAAAQAIHRAVGKNPPAHRRA